MFTIVVLGFVSSVPLKSQRL